MQTARGVLELRTYFGNALLDVQHVTKPRDIVLGEGNGADIFACADGLPEDNVSLLVRGEEGYSLRLLDGLEGAVSSGGRVRALKLLKKEDAVPLHDESKVVVKWAGVSVAMRFVAPPDKIEGRAFDFDLRFLNVLACVFLTMTTAIFSLQLYPYDADAIEELMLNPTVVAKLSEPPKPPEQQKAAEKMLERLQEKGGAKAPAAAGVAKPGPGKPTLRPGPPALADLPIFRALRKGGMAQVLGENGGIGGEVAQALDGLRNDRVAERDGLAVKGDPKSDGPGETLGLPNGDPQTKRAQDYGVDRCTGPHCKKKEYDVVIDDKGATQTGALAPELIRAVMHENRNAFRYCYERVLQVHKELEGVVKLQFVIGPFGQVLSVAVKDTTLKSKDVEQCLQSKVHALTFPKPLGGGVVIVNYPFVFKAPN